MFINLFLRYNRKMSFIDNASKSPHERVENLRKYLESIDFESQRMGTIDQAVANWAKEKGFPEAAMGGRRSRSTQRAKAKAKAKTSHGRKGRKTRRYKK